MNLGLIRQRKHGAAKPFALVLKNGTKIRVAHPDCMAVSPRRVWVIGRTGRLDSALAAQVMAIEELRRRKTGGSSRRHSAGK
jgi:ABC-type lipoprotein export system ATPase subunit